MKVRDALNAAIREGVKDGTIDRKKHGPVIEAARKVSSVMDQEGWPIVNGKIDNVSPSVFLKYCEDLGIIAEKKEPKKEKKTEEKKEPILTLVGNSKWKKASND